MKTRQLLTTLTLGLGLTLAVGLFAFIGRAAPGNPVLDPPHNSHTAPLTTAVSITYDEPISAATVTSHTFAVHAMQSGLVTATHSVSGGRIIVTPTRPFHQGELVYAIATTGMLGLDGTEPLSATQWQFNAGQLALHCASFTDIEAELTGIRYSSATWGDYDNDGDLDILLTGMKAGWWDMDTPTSRVYRNDNGNFTDIEAGLTDVGHSSAAWGDYDNDGDLDILLTGSRASQIYRNDGGNPSEGWAFTNIEAGLTGVENGSVAWGDYDNDGDLDILLTGYVGWPDYVSQIYRNDDGNFIDIGAGLPGVGSGSAAWGDYDNDGDLDILLTGGNISNDHRWEPMSRVYRNDAGTFTDIGAGLMNVDESAAWGDYDNDGDLDILLTGWNSDDNLVSLVYRNDPSAGSGRSFTDIEAGLIGVWFGSVAWGDYDNDGDLDILLTGNASSETASLVSLVHRNDGGNFTDIGAELPDVYYSSAAWGDYDNDGDLDILLTGISFLDSGFVSWIYRNDPSADSGRSFTDIEARLPSIAGGSAAWGDYDNDDDLDILLTGWSSDDNLVSLVYRNDPSAGSGRSFTNIEAGLPGVGLSSVAWGDYDNDGDLDILLTGTSTNTVQLSAVG